MSITEIVLGIAVLVALIARISPGQFGLKTASFLAYGTGVAGLIHLVEGTRWQMIPLLIFALVLLILSIARGLRPTGRNTWFRSGWIRIPSLGIVFILYLGAVSFPLLLPVVDLPAPQGPYMVGRMSYRLADPGRPERFTEAPDDIRELLVTVWYPAEPAGRSRPVSYWERQGITGKIYSRNSGMGGFWYSHLSRVRTNSIQDAPVSSRQERFPILLYSPSYYGLNTENTMLMESFASQGYIVFSMAHTYECAVSVFPDDPFIEGDLEYISGLYDSHADREKQLYEEYRNTSSPEEKLNIIEQILKVDDLSTQLLKERREDAVFVLDELERWNRSDPTWRSRLDLDRVGIVGWSFGGATAMEACMADPRFAAGINLDGTPYGPLFNSGGSIDRPFMLMRSESGDEMEDLIGEMIWSGLRNDAYIIHVDQAEHGNFCDFPLFFKLYRYLGYWGAIDPSRLLEIENTFVVGFFDRYLKGMEVEVLSDVSGTEPVSPSSFPELIIRGREAPSH